MISDATPQEIRLAIVGSGNRASPLVQGLSFHTDADPAEVVPALMHPVPGGGDWAVVGPGAVVRAAQ